jgi:hypothetical protein
MKTTNFWWWALVILCASSALDGPIFLLGLGPSVGLPGLGFAWPIHFDAERIQLLIALEYLGAVLGFAAAEEIVFCEKNRERLSPVY